MIQDPEYVKKVHKALTDKVDGFNKSLEEFSASLNDDKYVSNVYKALSDKVDGFSKTPEQFKSLVSSPKPQKKNSNSTGTTPQKVSATKPQQKNTTSVGEKPVKTTPSGSSFGDNNLIDKFGFKSKEEQKKAGDVASKVKVDVATPKAIKSTSNKEVVYKTNKQNKVEKEASIFQEKVKKEEEKVFINDFRNATLLPQDTEKQIYNEVVNEVEGKGILNTISQSASNLWNKILPYIPGAPSSEKELEQLKSDVTFLPKAKEEYRNTLIKQGYNKNEITDEILTKGAIDLEVNKRIEDKKLSLANDYLDNLPNEIKDRLEFNTLNEVELKTPEVKRQYEIIKALDKDLTDDNNELLSLEELAKNNNGLSQEESLKYNSLLSSIKSKIDFRNKIYKKYESDASNLTTIEEEYDLFKRSYGFEDKAGKLLNAVADLGLGAIQFVNMLKPGPTQDLVALEIAGIKDNKDKLVAEKLQKQVEDSKNVNDILDYGADVILSQAPNIALGYLTGGTGMLAGIGTSSTGNKYSELVKSNIEGETDYSKLQMYIASGIYGGSEMLESNTLKMIGGGKKLIGKALKNESTKNVFKESLSKKTLNAAKEFAKNYKGELGEELTTYSAQKLTDIVVLDMDSKDVFKNAKEEIKSIAKDTGVMTIGLNLFPATISKVVNAFASKDYTLALDKNNKQIEELSKIVNNKEASDLVRNEAKDKVDALVKSNEDALINVVKNTSELSDDLIDKVIDLETENSNLKNKANDINNDSSISKGQKEILLSGLKDKFLTNESLRDDIVSGRKKSFDILPEEDSTKLKVQAAEELKSEAIASGIEESKVNIKEEEITKRAIDNYEKQSKETTVEKPTKEGLTGQENVQDVTATQGQQDKVVQEKNKVEELRGQEISELKEQVENSEEFITDGKVDANKIAESDNAKAKEIYAKYDKLLKPLLTNIKTQEDAIQKQSTSEGVLRPEQSEMGLQEMVEGDQEPEVTTEEVKSEEEVRPKKKTGKKINVEVKKIEEEKQEVNNVIETSKNGLNHSRDLAGESYELEGEIGLVQGYSVLTGEPVFISYKGDTRTRVDVDSFVNSNKLFTDEELSKLKDLKKKILEQENSLEKNPFETQGNIATSDSVPDGIKKLISGIVKGLGSNVKIFITTDNDLNQNQFKKHGLFGKLSPVRSASIQSASKDEFGGARFMSSADAHYIYYDGNLSTQETITVVTHELGHILEKELFRNASEETKLAITKDYNEWYSNLSGKSIDEVKKETRDLPIHRLLKSEDRAFDKNIDRYISSFDEWFADNVSKWARTSEKPKTLVDKFFKELYDYFKEIHDYVTKNNRYSKSLFDWLDSMYENDRAQDLFEVDTDNKTNQEEVTKIKSDLEASKERLKNAFDKYKTVGIAFDPKNQLAKDKELVKALLDYAYNNIRLGKYNAVKLIEDLAKDGIEITRDGAKYIFDRASKRVQRDINKTVGVKPKPTEQKRINKAYSIGIADQKLENKKKKEKDKEVKEVKSETSKLNKDRKSAIKNVKGGKTGFINRNSPTFRLVSLNPKILKLALTPEMFEKYKSQINVLSKRRLSLDLSELGGLEEFSKFVNEVENNYIDTSEKILSVQNQIDAFEELNPTAKREAFKPSEDLKDLYNENKGLFTFNNVDSETTAEENEELSNNKEEVINNIDAVRKIAIDSDYSPTSKSFEILSLFADLKQSDLDMLNRNQVIGLNNAINAIVDGFEIPTYANDIFTAIMANRNKYGLSKDVERSYKKTGLASSKIFKAIDSLFKKFRQDEKTKAYKTNLTSIDAAFKIYGGIPKVADIVAENFKGIPILRYIMGAIQKQQGRVSARVEEMMSNLDKVREKLIEKSKDYEESLMKIHFAFLSAQNNSNPDNKTIQTAKDSFLANSKSSSYTESERKKYAEFLKKYGDYVITYDNGILKVTDGNGNEVSDFFTKEEIDSYNAIRKELDAQAEAAYESQFYHKKNAAPLPSNYFPQNNYTTVYGNEELKSIQKAFENPTLKSGNTESRVVKRQAHAVGHNPFSIAISAVKSVEMQHKLLTDVNIAKRALSDLIEENEGNEELKFLYENILGVVNKFVEQAQNATRIEDDSIGNDVSRALENIFFRSTLASVDRTVKDLTANYTGLILSDGEKLLSSKLTNDLKDIPKEKVSDVLKNFLINSGASQPTRLMNNDFDVKTSRIDFQTEGASSLLTNRGFSSKFKTFIDSVTRKTKLNVPRDFFKRINEQLQSFSDNAPALSLWVGSFYKEFEALSGTSVDIQKIASGDKAYLLKYKNEIEIASLIANYTLSSRLGSKNIAEGVQKIIDLSRNQGGNNVFEKYMNYLFSRFRIISARDTRTAINNLVQNGFGNENGAQERIIVGNALRSIVYTALAGVIPLKFASLLMGGDDDEEKIKDSLDDMSSDPDFMKGIVETYSKYEEKANKLEDSDEYMKSILELYRSRRSELMNLLKDDRFREAVEARYRFFAREHFNKIINGHSANVDAMKKLDGNMSYINNIIKMIDDKDDPVNYTKYVDLLSYINSEYGYMKYSPKERKDILDKAISRMEDDGFYTFREKNGGLNEKGEYDITTSEGKFKVANLFQTIDMLKNYRENSIEGRALKGGLEFAINTAAGSRGNIKVRAISTLVEVLNKYQREERYGFYDSSKDRVTNGFGRTMLNGETAFNGKFKVEEDDVTGKSLGLSKEISDVVNMTVPELAMISKMASEPKYSDIGMLLGLPTSTDLSKILREVEKDEVYQSSRGKVFYDASEKNKVFNKKDTLYKFPIKMDVEKSKIIKK